MFTAGKSPIPRFQAIRFDWRKTHLSVNSFKPTIRRSDENLIFED